MGMIWNSDATLKMIQRINSEFSNDMSGATPNGSVPPIDKWRAVRYLFDHPNSNELKNIAANNKIFADGGYNSEHDQNWQAWLGYLGKSGDGTGSVHEKLRKAICDGLDGSKYDLIYFSIVPLAHGTKIKVTAYPDTDDRVMGVLIETPTIGSMMQLARKKARARTKARNRAKAKKAKKL